MDATNMTLLAQTQSWSPAVQAALGLVVGGIAGLSFFGLLWRNARLFAEGRAGRAILTQAARLCVLALVMTALARVGVVALLSALVGVTIARETLVRGLGRIR